MYATVCHLPQASLTWLQDLTQLNLDSRDGLDEAAESLRPASPTLSTLFTQIAGDRAAQARELRDMVARNDQPPRRGGCVVATVNRGWMNLRDAVGGGEHGLLREAERGECHLQKMYEEALDDLADCECYDTLRNHLVAIKASREHLRGSVRARG